jgi:hypothetical protein
VTTMAGMDAEDALMVSISRTCVGGSSTRLPESLPWIDSLDCEE